MRAPLLVVVVPMFFFFWYVVFSHKLDPWSFAAGAVITSALRLIDYVRGQPPQHVQNWQRGAEGERRTEKALRPLERKGWTISHDLQRQGRSNFDHIAKGPRSVFLLETKNLSGTVAVEDGCLVTRPLDHPQEPYRNTALAPRVLGQSAELSKRIGRKTGRAQWVQAVVVVWGNFPQNYVKVGNVVYIHGDRLRIWLDRQS